MPEFNQNNIEAPRPQTPEDLAALEQLRKRMEEIKDAGEVLDDKEKQPQTPVRTFQAYPSSVHAEQVQQIVGQPKVETDVHEEIPGMKLPSEIKTEDQRRKFVEELIASTPDTTKPGVADQLNKQMEQVYSAEDPQDLKKAA